MDKRLKDIQEAADFLRVRMRGAVPEVGIILGSGLGKLGESIEAEGVIPYREIPNFAPPARPPSATRATSSSADWPAASCAPCRVVSITTKAIRWKR